MPYPQLDRQSLTMHPLAARANRLKIEDICVSPTRRASTLSNQTGEAIASLAEKIKNARQAGKPVVLAFGAHAIKNGLSTIMAELASQDWITHLATNGAGIIHDWEFSFQGMSGEHVGPNVASGTFGNWEETGYWINLALNIGAYQGLGYGESMGRFIAEEILSIPNPEELSQDVHSLLVDAPDQAATAAELLQTIREFQLSPGVRRVTHKWKQYSLPAAAYELGTPFTCHPMLGHDIIYNHPMNNFALLGKAAQRDFLTFAHSISEIGDGGVYISLGSAIMSPMIFEKSLSMSQNLAIQAGSPLKDYSIAVIDLAESSWDWQQGEPPPDRPEYYLRYNKTFSRMGGDMSYIQADNVDFLLVLHALLR